LANYDAASDFGGQTLAAGAPSEPDVFLSYAREDEVRARELATALEERRLSVFWDREIPPGQTWHSYIGEALANARCVVVAWSRHSVVSQWVLEEASEGRDRRVLVPVLFEAVPPPFGFRAIQAASLVDWRPGRPSPAFHGLLRAVQRIVGGQAGSEAAVEAVLSAPRQPAPSEPAPKSMPSVRPSTPPPISRERRTEPVRPPNGQINPWSGRWVVAIIVGLFAILWWLNQPEPTPREPLAEAEPSTAAPAPSKPAVKPEARPATPSPPPEVSPEARPATPSLPPKAYETMRDCPECPQMVLVPAGEFTMGSPSDEWGRYDDEGPQRKVAIAEPFWVGRYEVTFVEWDACVAGGGCSSEPIDAGWGRGNRPVINVSWNHAKEYVGWLNQETGKTYRLLSEAEWEYAARGGSTTAYWWGQDVGKGNANCSRCGSEWGNKQTAPVGSFWTNDFGLYDTAGNVWEWVEDCWHDNYDGAPTDGSVWLRGDCHVRVRRGGSWASGPGGVRSANRITGNPASWSGEYGFRVARSPD
jgi:formylglycine-generating enzyme required for sulfatase activity